MNTQILDTLVKRPVMVIDDDVQVAHTVARILQQWGLNVETAYDIDHALQRAELTAPGLAVLDLRIGAHDGVEVMRHFSQLAQAPAVILMSGVDHKLLQTVKVVGEELGLEILGVLSKPFDMPDLYHLLAGPRLPRSPQRPSLGGGPTVDELHAALAAGEIVVHYQPKVSLADSRLEGVEALIRWHHPRLGLLCPDDFLGLAEQGQLNRLLTQYVLCEALADLHRWDQETGEAALSVAVNLPPVLLEDIDLPLFISTELAQHWIAPERLVLEVVESGQLNDTPAMREGLTRLRLLGVQVAMDDFGTGLSSLKRLLNLPFTMLKLDKSFVTPMLGSAEARVVVHQTLAMAHELNLVTVAEGIEDATTFKLLAEMGCEVGQGYHMGRPMSAAEFSRWRTEGPVFASTAVPTSTARMPA